MSKGHKVCCKNALSLRCNECNGSEVEGCMGIPIPGIQFSPFCTSAVYWAIPPLWCCPKHDSLLHDHTRTDGLRSEAVAGYPIRVTADVKLSYRVSSVARKSVEKRPVVAALFILSEMIFTCLMLQRALQHDLQFTLLLQ